MKLFLMNTSIITNPGTFKMSPITNEEGKALLRNFEGEVISAIGHDASAEAMSIVLDQPILVNRVAVTFEVHDSAIALKMRGRIPEGVILNLEEMNKIGFDLFILERVE